MSKSLLTLVGTKFRKSGLAILKQLTDHHPVLLVREPQNQYDSNAIAVYVPIGYVKKEEAQQWAAQFDTLNPVGTFEGKLIDFGPVGGNQVEIEA